MAKQSVLIIGAGIAGASAAWHLASRGHEVTVLERDVPAGARGSSHGSARIFRFAYHSEFYAAMVQRAVPWWRELEAAAGEQMICVTGAVDFGPARDVPHLARVLSTVGVEHEVLSAAAAGARYPQISFDSDVLFHPAAGVLDAEGTVRAMLRAAEATGNARVVSGFEVARLERGSGAGTAVTAGGGAGSHISGPTGGTTDVGFTAVSSSGARESAELVLVAAGGYLPRLLGGLGLPEGFVSAFPQLTVRQEMAFHMPWRQAAGDAPWPTLIHSPNEETTVYALPGGRDGEERGQKIAHYLGGRVLADASEQDGVVAAAARERIVDYAREYLPGLVPQPYAETTCILSTTPSEDFVLEGCEGVWVFSPCSGHGAKFAPLLGVFAADAIAGDAVPAEFSLAHHARVRAAGGVGGAAH